MTGTPPPAGHLPSLQRDLVEGTSVQPINPFVPFEKSEIERSVPDRFEEQARKYPHHVAVKTRSRVLTYLDLNRDANRIGRDILARSTSAAKPVALLLEKNASMMVATLGTLKAARTYVPLDPAHPHMRLSHILDEIEAEVVVTDNRNLSVARKLTTETRQLLNVDDDHSGFSPENIGLSISPDSPCYIIYTSGSTAEPKGVVQTHRNVLQNIRWHTNSLHTCAHDRLTLLGSAATGQAVTDIYGALLNGACLYPFDIGEEGFSKLASWLMQEEITIYHSSASVFRSFADSLSGDEEFPKVRLIKVGSETVSNKEVEAYKKHFSADCILVNTLSATEVGAMRQYMMNKETARDWSVVPAGHPVDDKKILLLDETGQEVGLNAVGEICIESRYLATEYWRKPELTSAVFSPSPSGNGLRIYRSGDLGRMDRYGRLIHLGRKDSRVKIRGYAVEIAEVEAALRSMAGVADVAVVAHDGTAGQRLVAYVVASQRAELGPGPMREHLAQALPDFMIPSAFVVLEAMPRTSNGKVDRRALLAPEGARPRLDTAFIAPRTALEERLAAIWTEVLGISPVGVNDNFFHLGGSSLMAARVLARIRRVFDADVTMRSFFETPALTGLALAIVQNKAQKIGGAEIMPILQKLKLMDQL